MRYVVAALIPGLLLVGGLSCGQARTYEGPNTEPGNDAQQTARIDDSQEEPLLLEDEPLLLEDGPLLLDDDAGAEASEGGADNSRCHVCHVNYFDEAIAVKHARVGIGCSDCHGQSDAHIADESWAWGGNGTAPDKMFGRDKVTPFCMGCHSGDELKEPQHEAIVAQKGEEVCTDCHGRHRLATRKCKWR
ncbi:MAG: hypothetical protein JSW66_13785 [Phycisphaerales bacterium]|nr:MAG: hypothetical protein JSW66_13785 [Phycisphaerales bacterium]